jgi:hypothetical protein
MLSEKPSAALCLGVERHSWGRTEARESGGSSRPYLSETAGCDHSNDSGRLLILADRRLKLTRRRRLLDPQHGRRHVDHDDKGEIPLGPNVQEPEDEVCDYRDPHLCPPPRHVPELEGHCEKNDGQHPPSTDQTGKLVQEDAAGDELIHGDDDRREQEPDRKRIVRTCRSHR